MFDIDEMRELGMLGNMIAEQNKMVEFLDQDSIDILADLFGPMSPEWKRVKDGNTVFDTHGVNGAIVDVLKRPTENTAIKELSGETGKIVSNNKHQAIIARHDFVKGLANEHKTFVEDVKAQLRNAHTRFDLKSIFNMCIAHDQRLTAMTGRVFCNTLEEIEYNFTQAEEAIKRNAMAIIVHHVADKPKGKSISIPIAKYPVVMINGKAKAIAFDSRDAIRLGKEGYVSKG